MVAGRELSINRSASAQMAEPIFDDGITDLMVATGSATFHATSTGVNFVFASEEFDSVWTSGRLAALGKGDVLVAVQRLVNHKPIKRVAGGISSYVHIIVDHNHVVFSEALVTEVVRERCTSVPEINTGTGEGCSPAAQPMLNQHHAPLLMTYGKVA